MAGKKRASSGKGKADPRSAPRRSAKAERGAATKNPPRGQPLCRVVGMGASAGGLEAFEHFFARMPADSGLAFVLVSHLKPTGKSLMAELLAKWTPMPVCEVRKRMRVEPNRVYVAPPATVLHLQGRSLAPTVSGDARSPHLPVDTFFRSLAEERGEQAIGIILSGTGSDGTLGLKAISEVGGLTLVQDQQSAKYDGMPESAVASGVVDYILPVEQMPDALMRHVRQRKGTRSTRKPSVRDGDRTADLTRLLQLLHNKTGRDFTHYKHNTIARRVSRRMQILDIGEMEEYIRRVGEDGEEANTLLKVLLIGVTRFFRDPAAFAALDAKVLAPLFAAGHADRSPRVWVAGCATGEEAYSIAILLAEHAAASGVNPRVQVFATDLDPQNLEFARAGVYPAGIAADVNPQRLERFFIRRDDGWQVVKAIRENVIFSVHDLIKSPPFSKLDLISCRNVLIYFTPRLQRRLIPLFHYALKPEGALFLGLSEMIGNSSDLFSAVDKKHKLFRRRTPVTPPRIEFPIFPPDRLLGEREHPLRLTAQPDTNIGKVTDQLLLEHHSPACVVVDEHHNIVHFHGGTAKYLEAPKGAPGVNVLRLARPGLRLDLRAALYKAARDNATVVQKNVQMRTNDGVQAIDLTVRPLSAPGLATGLMLVLFAESTARKPRLQPRAKGEAPSTSRELVVQQLEAELNETRETLQATIDALEVSNTELRSSNEELLSMNEEFQSTNEELDTSKEELQSINEEFETVNAELQGKVEQLARANNDISNLLGSTQIAVIFLGNDLCIRNFTPATREVFNLRPGDLGRPIHDITTRIDCTDLLADVHRVLNACAPTERTVQTQDGKWYILRCLPYRTVENVVDGVVITFLEITELKRTEMSLREAEAASRRLAAVVRDSNDAITVQDFDRRILAWNRGAERMYGYTEAEALRLTMYDLTPERGHAQMKRVSESLARGESIPSWEMERITKDGRMIEVWATATVLHDDGRAAFIATTERDVTERKRADSAVQESEARLRAVVDTVIDAIITIDSRAIIQTFNPAAERIFNYPAAEVIGKNVRMLMPSPYKKEHDGYVRNYLDTGQKKIIGIGREVVGRRRDGSTFPAELSVSEMNLGGRQMFVGLIRDISERKEAERELKMIHEQLETRVRERTASLMDVNRRLRAEKAERKRLEEEARKLQTELAHFGRVSILGEMVSGLAHSLNQPLCAMLSNAQAAQRLMKSEPKIAPKVEPLLADVVEDVQQAADVIRHLRDFLRKGDPQRVPVRLDDVIRKLGHILHADARDHEAVLNVSIAENLPMIVGDPIQLQQVVLNLVRNGFEAMLDNPLRERRIQLSVSSDDASKVHVAVCDRGSGLTDEALASLFEPFYTTKQLGLGMGLSISRSIIESHEGRIWATRNPDRGTTFHFTLPMLAEAPPP